MTNASTKQEKALSAKSTKFVGNAIVTQRVTIHQPLLICLSQHRLTDAINLVEALNVSSDKSLSLIAGLQNLGVAA